jgi:hypothetical protein
MSREIVSGLRRFAVTATSLGLTDAVRLCVSLIGFSAGLVSTGCSTLPRDPHKTLESVRRQRVMRVGVVENPPWVVHTAPEPAGAEVELVWRFAASLGATPKWFWAAEQPLMEALEHFQLDIVIAGIDAATPWAKKIGLTRPYFEERVMIGVPRGVEMPETIRGLPVAVKGGNVTAACLVKRKAIPQTLPDIAHASGPAAGVSHSVSVRSSVPPAPKAAPAASQSC